VLTACAQYPELRALGRFLEHRAAAGLERANERVAQAAQS